MTRCAAVVFQDAGGLHSLPADIVRRIMTRPAVSPVPASDLGLSFVRGRVAVNVELGTGPHALVCDHASDSVTLSGVTVEHVGFFDVEDDCVVWHGKPIANLNIADCLASALNSATPGAAE